MEGSCSTDQSPQWAVVPMEDEELLELTENTNYSCTLMTRSSPINITGKLKLRCGDIVSPEENTQHLTEQRMRTEGFGLPQRLNFQVIS
jgi:hypothetical protein